MTQDEFEALLHDTSKQINEPISWAENPTHAPTVEFRVSVESDEGYPIFVKGSYNKLIQTLTYVLIHRQFGRIYGLDLAKDHRNPDGQRVGEIHKHRWDETFRDKQAYCPPTSPNPRQIPSASGDNFAKKPASLTTASCPSHRPNSWNFSRTMTAPSPCDLLANGLGELFACSQVGDYTRIRTPYTYPDGDILDLFLRTDGDTTTLSDLGETNRWLNMQTAAKFRSQKQDRLIQDICLTHRIEFYRGMLLARLHPGESLASSLMRLAQAALQVADLWFTFRTSSFSSIKDEVEELLGEWRISYERDYKLPGASGRNCRVDFYARSRQRTTLIAVLSTGSRASAQALTDRTFATWYDLRGLRTSLTAANFLSLIDDNADVWAGDCLSLLAEFSKIVYWSQPDRLREWLVG